MDVSGVGSPSRARVGYVASTISDKNGLAIWSGLAEVARQRGVDVLCFAGGELHEPGEPGACPNALYDLISTKRLGDGLAGRRLDGLVLWASSLGNYVSPEALVSFCRRFEPLPMIAIGVSLPGIPGVVLDSYGATRAAICHLVEAHGRRRLACIRGPAASREALERYRAYCDTLALYGLTYDPDLVSPPYHWGEEGGLDAVHLFHDERKVDFDAIVAGNDRLALSAMAGLQARGRRVPEDVAIVGFDDGQAGRVSSPTLTTVRIRMAERGREAMRLLLARIEGGAIPQESSLPARLVIRRSCGCPDLPVARAGAAGLSTADRRGDPSVVAPPAASDHRDDPSVVARPAASDRRGNPSVVARPGATTEGLPLRFVLNPVDCSRIAAEMDRELDAGEEPIPSSRPLLDAFLTSFTTGEEAFLSTLDAILQETAQLSGDLSDWQGAVSALRSALLPWLADDADALTRAECLWHQARVLIGDRAWRAQAYDQWRAGRQSARLHTISRALGAARDVAGLMEILAAELPPLGIRAARLALNEERARLSAGCRLVLAYNENGRMALPAGGEPCPSAALACGDLVPGQAPLAMVAEPLYYGDESLGFLMLDAAEAGRPDGELYRVLQEQISAALKSVLLLQENVELYHRALDAQQAAQEGQRLAEEANRLKSRFLSMVSHELRTPLVLLEGLSEMMLRDAGHGAGAGDRPLLPEPYRQDLARIQATAQQLGGLVRDVLDLARSQMGQLRLSSRPLDVAEALRPVVLVGEQMACSKGLRWRCEIAPDLPRVMADPARLQQVALNLIFNAVKFTAQGEVRLGIDRAGGSVAVSVSDTGLGVPVAEQEAIFDEFRQSERTAARGFGGLGVGLAICRQIISLHGGAIGVRSTGEEDAGSTFYFTLPALKPALPRAGPASPAGSVVGLPDTGGGLWGQTVLILATSEDSGGLLCTHLARQGFRAEVMQIGPIGPIGPIGAVGAIGTMGAAGGCWSRISDAPPGAVVLDLQPTSEYGWQIIDLLKQNPGTQDVPVLFYSLLEDEQAGSVLSLDYTAKPLGPDALTRALDRLGLVTAGGEEQDFTILIADDDPGVLALHAGIVRSQFPGCRVLTAGDGRQALDVMTRAGPPALVLLDLAMPVLDGLGVLDAMQADPLLRDVPVVVLTAQCLTEEEMARLNRGVASVLEKGVFSAAETLAHVEAALVRSKRLGSEAQRLARKTMAYIHEHYAEPIGREDMARHAGVSPRHLTRCFTEEIGLSPIDYLNRYRVAQAKQLLSEGQKTVTEVMEATGFGDSSYFAKVFKRETGVSPREWQHRT